MINLYLKIPNENDTNKFVDNVCEHLKGNDAFINNDIVVTNADINNVFCISLGDDYSPRLDVSAEIVGVEQVPPYVNFYLGENGFSGQKAISKKNLLDRISDRIDEMIEDGIIEIDVTLEGAVND